MQTKNSPFSGTGPRPPAQSLCISFLSHYQGWSQSGHKHSNGPSDLSKKFGARLWAQAPGRKRSGPAGWTELVERSQLKPAEPSWARQQNLKKKKVVLNGSQCGWERRTTWCAEKRNRLWWSEKDMNVWNVQFTCDTSRKTLFNHLIAFGTCMQTTTITGRAKMLHLVTQW